MAQETLLLEDDATLPAHVKADPNERYFYGELWSHRHPKTGKKVIMMDWQIEQAVLNAPDNDKPKGWKGRPYHLRRFMSCIWGHDNPLFKLEWNPNAVEIVDKYCRYQKVGVAAHASAAKSFTFAALGIAEFLLKPMNTKVLVTSHTKKAAQGKIWGDIQNAWQVAAHFFASHGHQIPGKLLQGQSVIQYRFNGTINPKAGLELIAGEQSEEATSSEKLQGYKSEKIIVLGDEWATMPISIHNTVLSNLSANPDSRLLAGFNPDTYDDPGAILSEPVGGWHTVDFDSMNGWPTKIGGYCIYFDGEKSPNVLDVKKPWKGILDLKMIADMRLVFPKGTKEDDKYVRGRWSATGSRTAIYDRGDIELYGADKPEKRWLQWVLVAGLDIGNAHGGDKTILTIGRCGKARSEDGQSEQVVCERLYTIPIHENTAYSESMSEQVVKQVRGFLMDVKIGNSTHRVPTQNLAVDCTGGGTHFAALLAREIGLGCIQVGFGEKASDRQVSRNDKRKGHEAFGNKVSELWGVGQQLIRTGQIRGLDPDTINELCIRTYKDDGGKRMVVEKKEDMKKRTNGRSPDRSDSFTLMIEAARVRCGLSSTEKAAAPPPLSSRQLQERQRQREELFGGAVVLGMDGDGWAA